MEFVIKGGNFGLYLKSYDDETKEYTWTHIEENALKCSESVVSGIAYVLRDVIGFGKINVLTSKIGKEHIV